MQVFLIATISADGKIAAREDQSTKEWTSKEDMAFFVRKTKEAGVIVMGRKTYDTIGHPLKDRENIVMSHGGPSVEEIYKKCEADGRTQVAIIGGAEIYSLWLRSGLVTDIYLTIEPILFGTGVPLVFDIETTKLKLVETEKLGENTTLFHFRVT